MTANQQIQESQRVDLPDFSVVQLSPPSASEFTSGLKYEANSSSCYFAPVTDESSEKSSSETSGKWRHHLLHCFHDLPSCLCVLACPCLVELSVAAKTRSVRLGLKLCVLTVALFVLNQLFFVLLGGAFHEAEVDIIDLIEIESFKNQGNATLEHGWSKLDLSNDEIVERFQHDYRNSNFWLAANLVCLLCGLITISRMALALILRQRARYLLQIGNPNDVINEDVKDVFSVFCCYMCALCQLKSTIEESEKDLELGASKTHPQFGFFTI